MESIHILAMHHVLPENKSASTIILENIVHELRKKTQVRVTWLIYRPERIKNIDQKDLSYNILDIHDFNNGLEIIQKVKPDLIFSDAYMYFIQYALSLAGKSLKIPIISDYSVGITLLENPIKVFKSFIFLFFQNSVPIDNEEKQFMKRGRFFIYKILFLIKTQRILKVNMLRIIRGLLDIIKNMIFDAGMGINSRFANNLHWLQNESQYKKFIKAGFDKSSLIITGSPLYDMEFKKIANLNKNNQNIGKIRVLLLTSALYEHGIWNKEQRQKAISGIVNAINEKRDRFLLTIKIHPSSESLVDYQEMINPIDSSIPIHQTGDVINYLEQADVVVAFPSNSMILTNTILSKIPLILCNFFNEETNEYTKRELVLVCKKPEGIDKVIESIIKSNPATEDRIKKFIKDFLYKGDGCAGERISNQIIHLLEEKKKNKK